LRDGVSAYTIGTYEKNKTHRKAKCNGKRLVFSSLKHKKIFADFNGGKLTSDVDLLALREVDKQIGLTEQLAQCIVDNRHPGYIKHSVLQMLRQRIYAVAAGYEALNDHQRLQLLRWCEKHNVYYIVGLARNSVLTSLGQSWIQQAQEQFQQSERKQHLYDDIYCQRGDMENRIKEQQLDLFSDRTSCHEFDANQFRVFLSAAAYILIETLRREFLKDTELARAQVGTIRIKLVKVAARVVHKSSRILFHICSSYPHYQLLTKLICRLIPRLNPSFDFT